MDAYVHRLYLTEAEFLADWHQVVEEVVRLTRINWTPGERPTDANGLRVRDAVVFHDHGVFASLHVSLEAPGRQLVLRITWEAEGIVVERLMDRRT